MKKSALESLSIDELWKLYEEVAAKLAAKLIAKKSVLDGRLEQLSWRSQAEVHREKIGRRPYPKVFPRFRNPDEPSQVWTGRGKQPKWLAAQLSSGRRIEDFRIPDRRNFL